MLYTAKQKGDSPLEERFYQTGEFAKKASVTLRTLRYYDAVGLLAPSHHTAAGFRLYTEKDLLTLQHILALKFLGFTLDEIKRCLRGSPRQWEGVLAQQKKMLQDKRRQIDTILRAITQAEALLQAGEPEDIGIDEVIGRIQMEQKQEWMKKYFSDEQLQKMDEMQQEFYSPEARQKLAQRGEWTEEDQKQASAQWAHVYSETQRLADTGADPAGGEAQALARLKSELLLSFTQGDPDIEAGLQKFWEHHSALPADEQPLASAMPEVSDAGAQFLEQAMTIYREKQALDRTV